MGLMESSLDSLIHALLTLAGSASEDDDVSGGGLASLPLSPEERSRDGIVVQTGKPSILALTK